MKRIILQVHDIKDPLTYSIEMIKKIQVLFGDIELIILIPRISQGVIKEIEIPFKHKTIITDDYMCNKKKYDEDVDIQKCILQQVVYEKIGKIVPLELIMKQHKFYTAIYKKIIKDIQPDLCICWNGQVHIDQTSFNQVVKKMKIPTLFLERGLIPNSIFYDSQGVNATSSVVNWCEDDYINKSHKDNYQLIKKYIKNKGVAIVKLKQKKIKFKDSYLLFPLQRDSDSNLVVNSKYFKNMYSILSDLNKLELPIDIHYRAHPEDPKNHYTKHLEFKNARLTEKSDIDLGYHLDNSELILTINSTIGFSALMKDKVVLTLGESIYAHKGFTLDYSNYLSLQKLIEAALDFKVDSNYIEKKNNFISQVIMNRHVVFERSHLEFLQLGNLEVYLSILLGER